MRHLNGVYTQRFNKRHGRGGHVFQGRYKAILVERETYLLELARYIVLNPVRAGMVENAEHWRWSSYRITAGLAPAPTWFDPDWLFSGFAKRRNAAVRQYIEFVANGAQQPSPWTFLKQQIFLGSDAFVVRAQAKAGQRDLSEIPGIQRRAKPKPLEEYAVSAANRDEAMFLAYRSGGHLAADRSSLGRPLLHRESECETGCKREDLTPYFLSNMVQKMGQLHRSTRLVFDYLRMSENTYAAGCA